MPTSEFWQHAISNEDAMKKSHPQNATVHDLASLFSEEAIERQEVIRLSPGDSRAFADALLDDSEPNEALKRAAADYLAWVSGINRD